MEYVWLTVGLPFIQLFLTKFSYTNCVFGYRSWRYEQELDNVVWKIDYRDICAREWAASHLVLKMAKVIIYDFNTLTVRIKRQKMAKVKM